jgi:tetratricopeptide (TPR) repeat protein
VKPKLPVAEALPRPDGSRASRGASMPVVALAIAAAAFVGARFAREAAGATQDVGGEPYAPSPTSAPLVSLGFREVAADLLWIRLTGYFGGPDATADGVAAIVEAIVALDPNYHRPYEYGARAITIAPHGVTQASYLRALAVLEKGITIFPDDWKLPYLAGQIYTQDLVTTDPKQQRAWDERGTLLTESAIRKPGAPLEAATWVAFMQTKLGQRDRAIRDLRELLLVTRDDSAREELIQKLSKLADSDSTEIAAEVFEQRKMFDAKWRRDRPTIPPTMYILLGPHPQPGFDMTDLATGGRDLVTTAPPEKLEPLD